jgi:hypothetical protein
MISLPNTSVFSGEGSVISGTCNVSGTNPFLMVSVCFVPDIDQEITSISCGSQQMSLINVAQIETNLRMEVWGLESPLIGDHTISINTDSSISAAVFCSVYNGIKQTSPVYRTNSGAGKQVTQIGVSSFSKPNSITIGIGAVNNTNSYVNNLFGAQRIEWDLTHNGFRCEAISAQIAMLFDRLNVENTLSEQSDWGIVIVGLEGE